MGSARCPAEAMDDLKVVEAIHLSPSTESIPKVEGWMEDGTIKIFGENFKRSKKTQ